MDTLLLSAIIGVVAGTIDIIPMVIQKLDKRATISAFLQYFFPDFDGISPSRHRPTTDS